MSNERGYYDEKDVSSSIWRAYTRTPEYKNYGLKKGISTVHPLIRNSEQNGLTKVIKRFIARLVEDDNPRKIYETRNSAEWVNEWRDMHTWLFKTTLRNRGKLRGMNNDVRFGHPGDEEGYKIPRGGPETLNEIFFLANTISAQLSSVDGSNSAEVCDFLAKIHYGFIRIHPFPDGNGRIARALTDQLAISLGYPPIIAGFPRTNTEKKAKYHKAIKGCIGDPMCKKLSAWIKVQLDEKIASLS